MNAENLHSPELVRSYLNWWQDAGYLCPTVAESGGWLHDAVSVDADFNALMAQFAVQEPVAKNRSDTASPAPEQRADSAKGALAVPLPDTHEGLIALMADASALPFHGTGRNAALPIGSPDARLCIVTDMPAQADEATGHLFSGDEGALLRNMVAAMGLSMDDVYLCPFAPRYAPMASAEDHAVYSALWRRHASFIKSERILVLGNQASQMIFGKNLPDMRGRLHDVNHDVGKMVGTATFHPRGLLKKPMAKRQAWRDLQFLMKDMGL